MVSLYGLSGNIKCKDQIYLVYSGKALNMKVIGMFVRCFVWFHLVFLLGCGVSEPERETGTLRILAPVEIIIKGRSYSISQVHCTVMQGNQTAYEGNHTPRGTKFLVNVKNLEPADDYSVFFRGRARIYDFISRSYKRMVIGDAHKYNIQIIEDHDTNITINWGLPNPDKPEPKRVRFLDLF